MLQHEAVRLKQWGYSDEGIAHELSIKKESVQRALERAGLGRKASPVWTAKEIAILTKCYRDNPKRFSREVSQITGRTISAVLHKLFKLRKRGEL